MAQLREKCPLGNCFVHSNEQCIRHHLILKHQFDVGMDMQAYSRAALIVSGLHTLDYLSYSDHSASKLPI